MEPPSSVGLFDVATTHHAPPKASDLSHRLKRSFVRRWAIDLIPGNFDLVKYSLVSEPNKLKSVQQRFHKFISQAKQEYDIVIIDCNPSSSFITLCALRVCTHLLVPVRPDLYSVLGLELVTDFLEGLPEIHPKPEIAVLLNGIPRTSYDRTAEDELRAHATFGPLVLTNKLRKSRLLEATPGNTGFATDQKRPYRNSLRLEIGMIVDELQKKWSL